MAIFTWTFSTHSRSQGGSNAAAMSFLRNRGGSIPPLSSFWGSPEGVDTSLVQLFGLPGRGRHAPCPTFWAPGEGSIPPLSNFLGSPEGFAPLSFTSCASGHHGEPLGGAPHDARSGPGTGPEHGVWGARGRASAARGGHLKYFWGRLSILKWILYLAYLEAPRRGTWALSGMVTGTDVQNRTTPERSLAGAPRRREVQ